MISGFKRAPSTERVATTTFGLNRFKYLMMTMMMILIKFNTYPNFLKHKFSVTGLSETWLNHSDIKDILLSGYHNIEKVRANKQGVGVGLYVNRSQQFRARTGPHINIENVIESMRK